jgi:hypothetical protein
MVLLWPSARTVGRLLEEILLGHPHDAGGRPNLLDDVSPWKVRGHDEDEHPASGTGSQFFEAAALEKKAKMHKNLSQTYGQPGGKPWQAA